MRTRSSILTWVGAVMYLLWALFPIAIGAYHTYLFGTHGPRSLFSTPYGIAVSAADMQDPARKLGSDAIEVYSLLLAGFGVPTIWGTISVLRGRRRGRWLNTIFPGSPSWPICTAWSCRASLPWRTRRRVPSSTCSA